MFHRVVCLRVVAVVVVLVLQGIASGQTLTSWTIPLTGNWGNPSNWSNGVPSGNYWAFINGQLNTVVTMEQSYSVARLDLVGQSNYLTGTAGNDLTITGTGSTWANATMSGTGVTNLSAGATMSISSGGLSRVFNNYGTASVGNLGVDLTAPGIWNNKSGSVVNFSNGSTLSNGNNFSGTFNNEANATFRKTTGSSSANVNWDFNNSGLVSVTAGRVNFNGTTTSNGTYATSGSGAIVLQQGTHTFNAGTSVTGPGFYLLGSTATLNVNATVTFDAFNFGAGTLGGTGNAIFDGPVVLQLSGTMNVTGSGTKTLNATRTMTIVGNGINFNSTFDNYGTSLGNSGFFTTPSGTGTWNNKSGSLFDFQGSSFAFNNSGGNSTFNNEAGATFQRTVAGGTTVNWGFNNNGTVYAQGGNISFTNDGTHSGTFTTDANRVISINGGTQTFNSGAAVNGLGAFVINNNATVNVNAPVTFSSFTVLQGGTLGGSNVATLDGAVYWSGGTITNTGSGSTTLNATRTMQMQGTADLAGTFNNNGTAIFSNATLLAYSGNGVWNNKNGSLFDIQSDSSFTVDNILIPNVSGNFKNQSGAVFRKSAGTGTSTIAWAFSNDGQIQANSGTILFSGSYTQSSSGSIILNGGAVSFGGSANIQGGISGGGNIGGGGNITQGGGGISPGFSPGHLNVVGSLTMSSTSTLFIELAGTGQGTSYDWLSVSGSAALGNAVLNVSFLSGFQNSVAPTDTFTFLTAGSGESGIFNGLIDGSRVFTSDGYGSFQINYDGSNVILSNYAAIAVPEPATVALLIGTSSAGIWWYRRRRLTQRQALEQDVAPQELGCDSECT